MESAVSNCNNTSLQFLQRLVKNGIMHCLKLVFLVTHCPSYVVSSRVHYKTTLYLVNIINE